MHAARLAGWRCLQAGRWTGVQRVHIRKPRAVLTDSQLVQLLSWALGCRHILGTPHGPSYTPYLCPRFSRDFSTSVATKSKGKHKGKGKGKGDGDQKPKPGQSGGEGAGRDFSKAIKRQAVAQSGGHCVFCGIKTTKADRSIDHAIPKSQGGNNSIHNAQCTCRTCNGRKGSRSTKQFLDPKNNLAPRVKMQA